MEPVQQLWAGAIHLPGQKPPCQRGHIGNQTRFVCIKLWLKMRATATSQHAYRAAASYSYRMSVKTICTLTAVCVSILALLLVGPL